MKIKMIVCSALAASLLVGCVSEKCERHHKHMQAKVSKEAAEKIALAKVPNGTVKEAELENEKGKLIWSFGFATPDSENTTEVNVDAITGAIVNMEQETPEAEAKEAAEDAAKAKPAKEKDDDDND